MLSLPLLYVYSIFLTDCYVNINPVYHVYNIFLYLYFTSLIKNGKTGNQTVINGRKRRSLFLNHNRGWPQTQV
jgi:hypothetical protein